MRAILTREYTVVRRDRPTFIGWSDLRPRLGQYFHGALALIVTLGALPVTVGLWWYGTIGVVDVALALVLYAAGVFGVEAGFHRYFSHRAFRCQPWFERLLFLCGATGAQGHLFHWTSVHRQHHRHGDRPGDLHSPHLKTGKVFGFLYSYILWIFAHEPPAYHDLIPDVVNSPRLCRWNRQYYFILVAGWLLPGIVGILAHDSWAGFWSGLLLGGWLRTAAVLNVFFLINSLCHSRGQRDFRSHDRSYNQPWLAFITFGASWHNTHHAFQSSADCGLLRRHGDICFSILKTAAVWGWVWELTRPTEEQIKLKAEKRLSFGSVLG